MRLEFLIAQQRAGQAAVNEAFASCITEPLKKEHRGFPNGTQSEVAYPRETTWAVEH
jgi:hypothetical protein